jgi:REP element-mobilizing transposase RayT
MEDEGVLQYAPTIPTTAPRSKGTEFRAPTSTSSFRSPSKTIGAIIRGYKSSVTKQINIIRKLPGFAVWQRNYYEHIIRNEEDLHNITQYIKNNPKK